MSCHLSFAAVVFCLRVQPCICGLTFYTHLSFCVRCVMPVCGCSSADLEAWGRSEGMSLLQGSGVASTADLTQGTSARKANKPWKRWTVEILDDTPDQQHEEAWRIAQYVAFTLSPPCKPSIPLQKHRAMTGLNASQTFSERLSINALVTQSMCMNVSTGSVHTGLWHTAMVSSCWTQCVLAGSVWSWAMCVQSHRQQSAQIRYGLLLHQALSVKGNSGDPVITAISTLHQA